MSRAIADVYLRLKVQEGVFLYTRNISPYDGGVYHQVRTIKILWAQYQARQSNALVHKAPILLPIFALLPQSASHPLLTGLVYIFFDLLNAAALISISNSAESVVSRLYASSRKHIRWDGVSIAAGYVWDSKFMVEEICKRLNTNISIGTYLTLL